MAKDQEEVTRGRKDHKEVTRKNDFKDQEEAKKTEPRRKRRRTRRKLHATARTTRK